MIDAATDRAAFQALQGPWSSVVDQAPDAPVQLTHPWLERWWSYFGNELDLHCLVFRDQAGPFGVVPLMHGRTRLGPLRLKTLRLIGNDFSSRSDILFLRRTDEAWAALLGYLDHLTWHCFDIGRGSGLTARYRALLESDWPLSIQLRESLELPLVSLCDPWEDWLSRKSRSFRRSIRRSREKCSGLSIVRFPADFQDTERLIDLIDTVARESWSFDEGSAFISRPNEHGFIADIMRDFHRRSDLLAVIALDGDQPAAFSFGVRFGATVVGLKTGFRKQYGRQSIGIYVMAGFVEMCMADGRCSVLDMDTVTSRGDYKRRWANQTIFMETLRIFRRTIPSRILSALYQVKKKFESRRGYRDQLPSSG